MTVSKSLFLCVVKLKKLKSMSSKIGWNMCNTVDDDNLRS